MTPKTLKSQMITKIITTTLRIFFKVKESAVKGAPRECTIHEECFHGMPLMYLLSRFDLQEALHGFHTLDAFDICHKAGFGLFAVHIPLENNITLCCRNVNL